MPLPATLKKPMRLASSLRTKTFGSVIKTSSMKYTPLKGLAIPLQLLPLATPTDKPSVVGLGSRGAPYVLKKVLALIGMISVPSEAGGLRVFLALAMLTLRGSLMEENILP